MRLKLCGTVYIVVSEQLDINHPALWHANAVLCIKKINCVASI